MPAGSRRRARARATRGRAFTRVCAALRRSSVADMPVTRSSTAVRNAASSDVLASMVVSSACSACSAWPVVAASACSAWPVVAATTGGDAGTVSPRGAARSGRRSTARRTVAASASAPGDRHRLAGGAHLTFGRPAPGGGDLHGVGEASDIVLAFGDGALDLLELGEQRLRGLADAIAQRVVLDDAGIVVARPLDQLERRHRQRTARSPCAGGRRRRPWPPGLWPARGRRRGRGRRRRSGRARRRRRAARRRSWTARAARPRVAARHAGRSARGGRPRPRRPPPQPAPGPHAGGRRPGPVVGGRPREARPGAVPRWLPSPPPATPRPRRGSASVDVACARQRGELVVERGEPGGAVGGPGGGADVTGGIDPMTACQRPEPVAPVGPDHHRGPGRYRRCGPSRRQTRRKAAVGRSVAAG